MPLGEHLRELRQRIVKSGITLLIATAFGWFVYDPVIEDLLKPYKDYEAAHPDKVVTTAYSGLTSAFSQHLSIAIFLGVLISSPVWLYQIWAFIAPALYKHEKKIAIPLLVSSVILFYTGIAFAYFVTLGPVLKFFVSVVPEHVSFMTDINSYLDSVLTLFFAFGVAFEIPVAVVLLIWIGVVNVAYLQKIRPYVIIGCFVVGMVLTPPDPLSQTLLAVPMWLLFEVGLFFGRLIRKRQADEAADDSSNDQPPAVQP